MAGRKEKEERWKGGKSDDPPLCSSLQVLCGGGEDSGAEQTQPPSGCVGVASP